MNWEKIKIKFPELYKKATVFFTRDWPVLDNRGLYDFFDHHEIFCYYSDGIIKIVVGQGNERVDHLAMINENSVMEWAIIGSDRCKEIRYECLIPDRKKAETQLFEKAFEILKARK